MTRRGEEGAVERLDLTPLLPRRVRVVAGELEFVLDEARIDPLMAARLLRLARSLPEGPEEGEFWACLAELLAAPEGEVRRLGFWAGLSLLNHVLDRLAPRPLAAEGLEG